MGKGRGRLFIKEEESGLATAVVHLNESLAPFQLFGTWFIKTLQQYWKDTVENCEYNVLYERRLCIVETKNGHSVVCYSQKCSPLLAPAIRPKTQKTT